MISASPLHHSLREDIPAAFARPSAQATNRRLRILNGLLVAGLHIVFLALLPWRIVTVPLASGDNAFEVDFIQTQPRVPNHISAPLHMVVPERVEAVVPPIDIASVPAVSATPQNTAPANAGGTGTSTAGSNAFPDATGVNDGGYLERLRQHIARFMGDPHAEGTVVLRFSIDKQGKLLSYEIAKSSGDYLVDEAALQMLRQAQPLPPIPDNLHVPGLRVTMPLKYKL